MNITEQEEQIREEARRDAMLYKSAHQQSTLPQTEEEIINEAQRDADLYNKHFGKVEPFGEGEQQLLIEKPDQATLQRMKDVELNTWKTEQERKARKYLRWLYEAGYQYTNAATLGIVKKILEHEEDMPPDVARDIIGQAAHFAGFLTTPVGLSKLGVGIGEKIGAKLAAKVLPKIIKSPKVLAWAEKIGEKTVPQVAKAMIRGSATLGLASAISDLTNMKDAVKRGKAGALMGLIFSGTSLAHLPKHPVISQMMRQVGGRALLSIANLYDPQVWKSLNKEQIARRVYDEILNTWFLARGYSPRVAVMKAAEVKDSIGAESQPTLFTPEELTKVTPWIKKPLEVSEKPTSSATAETPGKARPGEVEIKVEPNPDGSVSIKVKQQINKLTEEEFKKAYKERTLPHELTKEEYTEQQRRWMDEVEAEKAVEKMVEQKPEEKAKETPGEEKLTLEKMKEIFHPDYNMRIVETSRGFEVERKLEDEWMPIMKNAREEAVFKTRRGAEGFLKRQYPKELEVYEHAVKLARKEGRLPKEEIPKEERVAGMHIEPQPQPEPKTPSPERQKKFTQGVDELVKTKVAKATGIKSKDFKIKSSRIIPDIVRTHNENGGSTFNIYTGNQYGTNTYAVSIFPELSKPVDGKYINESTIKAFIDKHAELLKDPRLSVGTWYDKDDGITYLDIVTTVANRRKAIRLGKKYNQKAIYYLKDGTEINTGGTGKIPPNIKKEPLDERLRVKRGGKKITLYHFGRDLNTPNAVIDPHAMGKGRIGQEKRQFTEDGELREGYLSKSNWYSPEARTVEPHLWVGATLYKTEVPSSELLIVDKPVKGSIDMAALRAGKIGWYSPQHGQARIFIPLTAERLGKATFGKKTRVSGSNILQYIDRSTPDPLEAINKKIAEKGTESLTNEELELLKKKGIFQEVSPAQKDMVYHEKEPEEPIFEQPAEQKTQTLVDVYAKTPLGETEKVETIPADMVEKIKEYAEKKGVGDLISFGKARTGKWTNYLPPTEIKKYVEGYIRTLPRVPEGTSKEEAQRIWEEKTKAAEGGKVESEIKKMVKLEEKVETEPENITTEDLPFDGAVGEKLAYFTAEVHKAATKKAWRAAKMVDEALSGTRMRAPRVIKRALEKAGMTLDDEIMYNIEEAYAQKIASSARGHVDKYIKKMAELGVRDEIINSVKVMNRYPITDVVKVKKEKTGVQSAVIPKSLIKYIKEHYKGGGGKKFLWKKSVKYVTKQGKRIVRGFQVPQVFFKRIGLKEILYDPIRQGERDAEEFFQKQLPNLKRIFARLTKAEREQLFDYMASKQHRAHAMEKAGVKVPKLNDLNMRQQLALVKWKNWMKEYTPKLKELARLYGLDIKFFRNYFPMYTKKGIVEVDGVVDYPKGIRKSPFFKSFIERTEDVPYGFYERDAYKNAVVFLKGMSRALNLGKRTIGLKYLIDSDEFKNIINKDDYAEILDWYENLVGKVEPHRGARNVVSNVARQLRRWSTRAILTNPRVILKQGLSFLDVALMENTKFVMPDDVRQVVKRLARPTVTERAPEIAVVDMRSKADRALLGGITWADKTFAHGGYSKVLAAELVKMKGEGIPLDNKALRKAVRRVSDRIDLAMGGYTRAQIPHFYRTELGKAVLMFTSTINSRFQYYVENTIEGINKRDAFHVAKTMTAFALGAYLEAAITRLALHWQDSKEMLKDILKTGIGNIPPFASLVYGLEAGELAPTAWFKNINDAIAVMKKPWSRRLIGIAEIFGLPKQLRRTLEGLEAIKKGIKVSSNKTLEIKGFWEQLRAIINGKWGTLTGRQFFVERERKAGWNREVANKLAKIEGKHFRAAIKNMTTKTFKAHFWDYVKALPEGDKKKIREIIKEARKEGVKLSFESILRHLKEAFNE